MDKLSQTTKVYYLLSFPVEDSILTDALLPLGIPS